MTVSATVIPDRPGRGGPALLRGLLKRQTLLMSLTDQAVVSGFSFLVGIATARVVGISEFGRFAMALAFAAFLQVLHNSLVAAPMMSLAGRRLRRSGAYFSAVLLIASVLAAVGGLLAAAGLMLLFVLRDGDFPWGFAAMAGLLAAVQCVQFTVRRAAFAQGLGGRALAMDLVRVTLFVLSVAVLVHIGRGIDATAVIAVLTASSLLVTVPFGAMLRLGPVARRMLSVTAGVHWPVARWLAAVPVVTITQDIVMLAGMGFLFGDHAVGGVRAAQYLLGPVLVLGNAMENLIPLRATAAWTAGGVSSLRDYLLRVAVPLGLADGAVLLFFVGPAEFWLNTIFGPAFIAYAGVLRVLAVAAATGLVCNHLVFYFRGVQDTRPIFGAEALGVIVTLVALFPAAFLLGLMGIAVAVLAGQAASLSLLALAAVRHYRQGDRRGAASRPA